MTLTLTRPQPAAAASEAATALLRLMDEHGAQLRSMGNALAFLATDRPELAGIEALATTLADHAIAMVKGVEDVRALLNGSVAA